MHSHPAPHARVPHRALARGLLLALGVAAGSTLSSVTMPVSA